MVMPHEEQPLLVLRDVQKSFTEPGGGELPILDIPEFVVEAGEQVVIIGESGCGKTTMLHIIAGISRPDDGQVRIDGWDITLLSEAECDRFRAEHLGYVFQTFNLLPGFSALENVMLGMTFGKGRHEPARAKHLLERVGLGHRMTHKPSQLSVGEQQRVSVARAMANRPSIILADEPTANVDSSNQQQIIDLLREACAEEDVALVMVTHSPEVARQFSRVVPLEDINLVLSRT